MITIYVYIYLEYPTLHAKIPPIVGISVTCETRILGNSSINEDN